MFIKDFVPLPTLRIHSTERSPDHGHHRAPGSRLRWGVSGATKTYDNFAPIEITYPGSQNYSQMTYDGNGHCVKIVEVAGGSTTSTRQFVWSDPSADKEEIKELRDGSGAILSKYFGYGQTTSGSNYFYTRDQITSVRELLASAGSVQSQYSYSPYGQVTNLQSGVQSDFQFGGYYAHLASGLNLTVYRPYHPALGRWISRDPSDETDTINLYQYVRNRPTNLIDPLGLAARGGRRNLYCWDAMCCQQEKANCLIRCLSGVRGSVPGFIGPPTPKNWAKYGDCVRCCNDVATGCMIATGSGEVDPFRKKNFDVCKQYVCKTHPANEPPPDSGAHAGGMLMMMNPVCVPGGALGTY